MHICIYLTCPRCLSQISGRQDLYNPSIAHTVMKTATLTKKEDEFWETVYNQLVGWGIHEDYTYDICFMIIRAKFERLREVTKLV